MTVATRTAGATWTPLIGVEEFERRGDRVLLRSGGHRIALFRTGQGLRACANRCPHEGYPLLEGSVSEHGERCVLSCNWHNWKFDLATGANLMLGEGVRVYPLRVRDGQIEVDLRDVPPAARRQALLGGLRSACDEHDYERIAREQARYTLAGGDPLEPLRDAIHRSHDHLQWGWTHAYAAAADWLRLRERTPSDEEGRLACLSEALAHIGWDTLREKRYRFSRRRRRWHEQRFLDAVEAEDEEGAVSLLRGALEAGEGMATLEPALSRAALAHYNDFGHSLIYVAKAADLVRRLGPTVTEPLLLSLVRSLVYATREDLIPDFRGYAPALAASGKPRKQRDALPSLRELRGLGVRAALRRVAASDGSAPERLFRVLLAANAEAMLAFDLANDRRTRGSVADNVGWLDFTHALTFANAVRLQASRFPDLWPAGLLQMACFLGRNRRYTLATAPLARWRVRDETAFWHDTEAALLDHGRDDYIASAHLLKTTLAVREEVEALPAGRERALLLAALARFHREPMKRRHVRRTAHQALRFATLEG